MFYPSKPVVILILFIVLGPFLASSRKINLEKTFLKSQPRKSDMPSNTEADEDTEAIENIANLFSSIIGKNASTETAIKGTDGFHFQNPVADLGSELQTFSTSAVNNPSTSNDWNVIIRDVTEPLGIITSLLAGGTLSQPMYQVLIFIVGLASGIGWAVAFLYIYGAIFGESQEFSRKMKPSSPYERNSNEVARILSQKAFTKNYFS